MSFSSTQTTFWVIFSEVEPTRPTARKMYSSRKSRARTLKYKSTDAVLYCDQVLFKIHSHSCWQDSCMLTWISFGKVALNIMVWRAPLGGIVSCSTIRLIWGSKPISSILSASSKTRYLHRMYEVIFLKVKENLQSFCN